MKQQTLRKLTDVSTFHDMFVDLRVHTVLTKQKVHTKFIRILLSHVLRIAGLT